MTSTLEALVRQVRRGEQPFARSTWLKHLSGRDERLVMFIGALVCLLPLLWFESGKIIATADYNNPIRPSREFNQILTGWNPDNLGEPSFRQAPRLFPYLSFWRMGEALGLSPGLTQMMWFIALFALAYWSAWALIKAVIPERERRGWGALVAVLVYLLNPFTVSSWAVGHNVQFLAYAVAPLWLLMLMRTITKPVSLTSGLPLGLVSLLFASAANNPPIVATMIGFSSLLLVVLLVSTRRVGIGQTAGRILASIPWLVLLNAWWLLPFLLAFGGGTGYSYAGSSIDPFRWPGLSTQVDFQEYMRGLGFWGAYATYRGVPYLPWAGSFLSPILIATTTWLVGIIFAPLLLRRTPPFESLLAAALALAGIFLSKGINPPLADANRWMYEHLPGFYLFRSAYEKFGGLLYLGVLFALCALLMSLKPRGKIRTAMLAITITASACASWPLLTGRVMPQRNVNGVASVVHIPNDYNELVDWTRSENEVGTVLSVPQSPLGYIKTTWAYAGADFIYNYSAVPVITGLPDSAPQDGPRFATFLSAAKRFNDSAFLSRLGITHVIARTDVDPTFYPGTLDPLRVELRLMDHGYDLVASYGALQIYEVPQPTVQSLQEDDREGVAVDGIFNTGDGPPFQLKLTNLEGMGIVLLPQAFDEYWKLSPISSQDQRFDVLRHFVIDDYANGWVINGHGDITLQADYKPGISLVHGSVVSLLALAAGAVLAFRRRAQSIISLARRRVAPERSSRRT